MNANRPKLVRNTPDEEVEIARQLAEDADTYEWTDEVWARSITTKELSPSSPHGQEKGRPPWMPG